MDVNRFLNRTTAHLLNLDADMTVNRLRIFLLVEQKGTCTVQDLVQTTGLYPSTVSRALHLLADKPGRGKKDGLRWVTIEDDPKEPRRSIISVSQKGKRVLAEIQSLA